MSFYSSNGCWTEHYNYEEIANLTNVQMGDYGKISKEVSDKIQKKIDDLFVDAFADGYSLDGGEISYENYEKLLKTGWRPEFEFQQCYSWVLVDDKMCDWYELSDDQRKQLIESGEYFDMEKIW